MRPLKYRLTTLVEVEQLLDKSELTAFDVETKGFYGTILLAQFYQDGWSEALLVSHPEVVELTALINTLHIVCHNTSYEVSTIQTQMGAVIEARNYKWSPKRWDDTLLLSKLQFFDKEKYALDECYRHAFHVDPYTSHGLNKKTMQDAWGKGVEPTDDMYTYAALDVFYLLDLYHKCESWVESSVYQLDHSATSKAFEFQTNGYHFNRTKIATLRAKHQERLDELGRIMQLELMGGSCNSDDPRLSAGLPININSWQQVRPYIGEEESDDLALSTFALEGNERAKNVNEARKLTKQISFLDKFIRESSGDRIFGKFTFTTKSGRGNCKDQNLQQLPRKTKEVFEAEESNVLVISDFAQLELRYACAYTGESVMEKLFREGKDLHQFTADMMGVPRQEAKTCNFNLLYLGSAKMLRSIFIKECQMLFPLEKVASMKRKWHKLWPTITYWQDDTVSAWRKGEFFETTLGRKFKSKLYTDAANLPISGGSADISKLAMHKMFKELDKNPELKAIAMFCNFVHDSFVWECPNDEKYYKPLADLTANAMKEAWFELVAYTKIPDLPMPVEVLVGINLGDLEYEKEVPIYKIIV